MNQISLCMIVKNESEYIENCLKSVYDIVDEIIIVDTGSTDNTKEICKRFTNKIYNFEWVNDFSKARNFSFSKATKENIMWLDADDILLEEDREKLKKLKQSMDIDKPISMIYDYAFDGNGNVTLSLKRNRIVKNRFGRDYPYWSGFVHEVMDLNINESYDSDIHVTHTRKHSNGTRNMDLFESKKKEGYPFSTRDTLYYAKELYYNNRFDDALEQFKIFFNKKDVWVEDLIDSLIKVSDIYRQLENINLERHYLYETFKYSIRAEALYRLGNTFNREKCYSQAIYFYESIINLLEFPKDCNGFLRNDEWNVKPMIELSCCYYYIGNIETATKYHNMAKSINPENPLILANDKYFN